MDEITMYQNLAKRNNWNFGITNDRPYFMKDGEYAKPDKTTSDEDKKLLAEIISEGSDEMAKLIIKCWDNNISISGPCSGIKAFHKNETYGPHFAFLTDNSTLKKLDTNLKNEFPDFYFLLRDQRLDFNYFTGDKELTKEEADQIFKKINEILEKTLEIEKEDQKIV